MGAVAHHHSLAVLRPCSCCSNDGQDEGKEDQEEGSPCTSGGAVARGCPFADARSCPHALLLHGGPDDHSLRSSHGLRSPSKHIVHPGLQLCPRVGVRNTDVCTSWCDLIGSL